ncbi:putative phage-like protein YoqJ [Pullulanibacillus pueri]|uniref:UPF0398 protein GCM10007096_33540 n=1 Tax=Pullulanibacillus pueri TaxID=1437324 RepID=A0A8J2ZY64_9BACL|nr:DUF1273 domain-containing protein [Pullulanibacillus pueri]MBM7680998.1 putative phage-like protein YoqJ [Pullulanibacillus pueri]GGH86254.1 UPF0398 protein [Pullulanibacillus pueri]
MVNVLAITGYKPHELGIFNDDHPGLKVIKHALRNQLLSFINEGTEWFLTSGQPGVELWASELVLELRDDYPQVQLCILTPFLEQEARWPDPAKEKYQMILSEADFVESITKRPYENPGQLRLKNDFIIQKSDGLLVLYDEETPGSPSYYLTPAKQKQMTGDYPIIYVNRYDLEAASQDLIESDPRYWSQ